MHINITVLLQPAVYMLSYNQYDYGSLKHGTTHRATSQGVQPKRVSCRLVSGTPIVLLVHVPTGTVHTTHLRLI